MSSEYVAVDVVMVMKERVYHKTMMRCGKEDRMPS